MIGCCIGLCVIFCSFGLDFGNLDGATFRSVGDFWVSLVGCDGNDLGNIGLEVCSGCVTDDRLCFELICVCIGFPSESEIA